MKSAHLKSCRLTVAEQLRLARAIAKPTPDKVPVRYLYPHPDGIERKPAQAE